MMVSHTQRKPYLISLKISYFPLKKPYLPLNRTLLCHRSKRRSPSLSLITQRRKMKSLNTQPMPKRVKRLKSSQATQLTIVHLRLRKSLRSRKKKLKFFLHQFSNRNHLQKRMTKPKKKRRLQYRLEMTTSQGVKLWSQKSTSSLHLRNRRKLLMEKMTKRLSKQGNRHRVRARQMRPSKTLANQLLLTLQPLLSLMQARLLIQAKPGRILAKLKVPQPLITKPRYKI